MLTYVYTCVLKHVQVNGISTSEDAVSHIFEAFLGRLKTLSCCLNLLDEGKKLKISFARLICSLTVALTPPRRFQIN